MVLTERHAVSGNTQPIPFIYVPEILASTQI